MHAASAALRFLAIHLPKIYSNKGAPVRHAAWGTKEQYLTEWCRLEKGKDF